MKHTLECMNQILLSLQETRQKPFTIMEACGTHTNAIAKFGIRELCAPNIRFVSGPGCPVCVTSKREIDTAIYLANQPNVILATFGDMLQVVGRKENLLMQKQKGCDVRIVYSPMEVFSLAKNNQNKEIIFFTIGFETTAPLIALTIQTAREKKQTNLSFYLAMKRMQPVLFHIFAKKDAAIDGFLCPGHVAVITGVNYFSFLCEQYQIPSVITGFEEMDLLTAIHFLVNHKKEATKKTINLYSRAVKDQGNEKAKLQMDTVFEASDTIFRGIGRIKEGGFALRTEYEFLDAKERFDLRAMDSIERSYREENGEEDIVVSEEGACVCHEILVGRKRPEECTCFATACSPSHPVGPCMVSGEGSCQVAFRYRRII